MASQWTTSSLVCWLLRSCRTTPASSSPHLHLHLANLKCQWMTPWEAKQMSQQTCRMNDRLLHIGTTH